jgi:transposase
VQVRLFFMQEPLAFELESCEPVSSEGLDVRKPHERSQVAFRSPREPELYPGKVSDLLAPDHVARDIRTALSKLDLSKFRALYADNGGAPYNPAPMLGILLLGCVLGQTGSGQLEQLCLYDIRFMHVAYSQTPDARTIRRFRARSGPLLEDLFKQVVAVCQKEGLVSMRRVAVDGTKMVSAASQVSKWLSKAEKQDIADMGLEPPDTSDPDARVMKGKGGHLLGYNAQAAVDCDSGVVVAIDITDNSSDYPSLGPMASNIIAVTGRKPDELVADAGYDSNEGICACAKLELDTVIAIQNDSPDFWTVDPEGQILCPMGKPAIASVGTSISHGKECRKFIVQECPSCMFQESCCSKKSQGRMLQLPVGCDPAERLNAAHLARTPEGRLALTERMATIERVFADVKWNKGIRRFRMRGKAGARIEWTLIHIARNLQILGKDLKGRLCLRFWVQSYLLAIQGLIAPPKFTLEHCSHY